MSAPADHSDDDELMAFIRRTPCPTRPARPAASAAAASAAEAFAAEASAAGEEEEEEGVLAAMRRSPYKAERDAASSHSLDMGENLHASNIRQDAEGVMQCVLKTGLKTAGGTVVYEGRVVYEGPLDKGKQALHDTVCYDEGSGAWGRVAYVSSDDAYEFVPEGAGMGARTVTKEDARVMHAAATEKACEGVRETDFESQVFRLAKKRTVGGRWFKIWLFTATFEGGGVMRDDITLEQAMKNRAGEVRTLAPTAAPEGEEDELLKTATGDDISSLPAGAGVLVEESSDGEEDDEAADAHRAGGPMDGGAAGPAPMVVDGEGTGKKRDAMAALVTMQDDDGPPAEKRPRRKSGAGKAFRRLLVYLRDKPDPILRVHDKCGDLMEDEIHELLDAIAECEHLRVVYLQNQGHFGDAHIARLVTALERNPAIWAANLGELDKVSVKGWEQLCAALPKTNLCFMYITEPSSCALTAAQKGRCIEALRATRKANSQWYREDRPVALQVGNMWWNPSASHRMGAATAQPIPEVAGLVEKLDDGGGRGAGVYAKSRVSRRALERLNLEYRGARVDPDALEDEDGEYAFTDPVTGEVRDAAGEEYAGTLGRSLNHHCNANVRIIKRFRLEFLKEWYEAGEELLVDYTDYTDGYMYRGFYRLGFDDADFGSARLTVRNFYMLGQSATRRDFHREHVRRLYVHGANSGRVEGTDDEAHGRILCADGVMWALYNRVGADVPLGASLPAGPE